MSFNFLLGVFFINSILFVVLPFISKKQFYWTIIIANLVFFSGNYYITSQLLGLAKPVDYNIPLFSTKDWPKDGLELLNYYYNEKRIYLLLNSQDNVPRLYSMPFSPEFIKKIKDALKANGNNGRIKIKFDLDQTDYGKANTKSSVKFTVNKPINAPTKHDYDSPSSTERDYHAE